MADLTAEFVDRIVTLAQPIQFDIGGLYYTSKPIHFVAPPMIAKVNVITLTALIKLYDADFEKITNEQTVVHVTSETGVSV